jgi:hypothetical protein
MESNRSGLAGEGTLAADAEAADHVIHVDEHGTEPGDVRVCLDLGIAISSVEISGS